MWNIFNNEDLSLQAKDKGGDKGGEEKAENKNKNKNRNKKRKRKTFDVNDRGRSFLSRNSFGSFSYYDIPNKQQQQQQQHNNNAAAHATINNINDYKLNNVRKAFRKKYRIAKTNLLKLVKIIKRFPEVNDENEENINVDVELIKKLNKIISKIDVEKLKAKKKNLKNSYLNKSLDTIHTKLLTKRGLSTSSAGGLPFQTNKSFIPGAALNKKNYMKHPFLLTSSATNFRNLMRNSSLDSIGTLYNNNHLHNYHNALNNNGYYYNYNMNLRNKKPINASFFNESSNALSSDFYSFSSLNSSFNKLNSLKKRNKLMSLNTRSNVFLKNYASLVPYAFYKNVRRANLKNTLNFSNYRTYSNYPLLRNSTQFMQSPLRRITNLGRRPSNKQVKKFTKEEKIRGLLRTASNEDELMKAIDVAKNAGLSFEAKLGDKKLQKLKSTG